MWITRVSIRHPVFATMVMAALCVLGLFSYQRLGVEQMPDIATMDEQGLKGYETYSWQAIFAPPKTPKPIVDKLNAEVKKALADPALQQRLKDLTMTVTFSSPDALAKFVQDQLALWGPITKATGVQVD